ncbi:MAG: peptidyl-tRNA hydrolase [Planctomycetota bacterium]
MTLSSQHRLVVGLGNPGPDYVWTRHNVGFHVVERIAAELEVLFEPASRLEGYQGNRAFTWARSEDPAALLVRPETFMNRSGQVVAPLLRFLEQQDEGHSRRAKDAAADEPNAKPITHPDGAPADLPTDSASTREPMSAEQQAAAKQAEAKRKQDALDRRAARVLVVYDDIDLDVGRLRIRPQGSAGGQRGMRDILEHLDTNRVPRIRVGIGRPGTDAARYVLQRFPPDEQVEIEISVAQATDAILDWLRNGDLDACMARFHSRWNQDS